MGVPSNSGDASIQPRRLPLFIATIAGMCSQQIVDFFFSKQMFIDFFL